MTPYQRDRLEVAIRKNFEEQMQGHHTGLYSFIFQTHHCPGCPDDDCHGTEAEHDWGQMIMAEVQNEIVDAVFRQLDQMSAEEDAMAWVKSIVKAPRPGDEFSIRREA